MNTFRKSASMLIMVLAVSIISLCLAGCGMCKGMCKSKSEHPSSEQPTAEHPTAEHPK